MPTNRYAKVRVLLKSKKAVVVNSKPFTIKLLYNTKSFTQPITLGIDSGYLNIGFSAITKEKELISGEVKLLKGMSERIKEKAMYIEDNVDLVYVTVSLASITENVLKIG
ncbi:RRXRR domain-containing protein [Clostridium botulinum]|nr:RRXRR domain-containing protein [Clostridium botulinum]MDI6918955.1 RRXRR domain-containing protein [Clostridium botulinum]WMU99524.1 RRXRR domain-containing protein [Clostridium botulinum]